MPALFGLVVVLGIYGWFRVHRGVDFTDEGFYVTSPLRLIFGERLFSSELMTLQKPFELILYPLFRLHPSVTLVEIRLAGWALHLLAYAVLATALYLYSASILISLAASTFVFFVGFDGIVTPGYNLLSRDFLIISLSLRLLATFLPARREVFVHGLSGIALFLGIVSYPTLFGLFVPLAVADAVQCYRRRTGRPATPWLRCCDAGNSITTAVLGVIFLFVLWTTGALRDWIQRFPMTTSFGLTSLQNSPVQTSGAIVGFLFDQSLFAESYSVVLAVVLVLTLAAARFSWEGMGKPLTTCLAMTIVLGLLIVPHHDIFHFYPHFCLIAILACSATLLVSKFSGALPGSQSLAVPILGSLVATAIYTWSTFYFSPTASWTRGSLGLPVGFAVSVTALVASAQDKRHAWIRAAAVCLVGATLPLALVEFQKTYRDHLMPGETAVFSIPKLHGIRSSQERVESVESLYRYLAPKIERGESLLVFDDAPLLYFVFDARPAYGLARAIRYNIFPETSRRLDEELRSRSLPHYAIRTVVAPTSVNWAREVKTDYGDYPLNDTLMRYYRLEKVIFPFEIWCLAEEPAHRGSLQPSAGP